MASDRHMAAAIRALMVPEQEFVTSVAEALAKAEREGMERAARIAREWRDYMGFNDDGVAISDAILSQSGEIA